MKKNVNCGSINQQPRLSREGI